MAKIRTRYYIIAYHSSLLLIVSPLFHFAPPLPPRLVDGLSGVGYRSDIDLDRLVKGTLPQRKVLDVAPKRVQPDDIAALLSNSMKLFT